MNKSVLQSTHFFVISILFLIGLLFKIAIWNNTYYVSRDSIYYLNLINTWYENGNTFLIENQAAVHGPILFIFLAKTLMLTGISALHAGLALNIVFGTLVPLSVYYLAYHISGKRIFSYVCFIVVMLHPTIIRLSIEIQRDIGFILFTSVYWGTVIKGIQNGKYKQWIYAGLSLALAFHFRIEALELIPITFILVFFVPNIKASINTKCLYTSITTISFMFCVILITFAIHMRFKDLFDMSNHYLYSKGLLSYW